MRVKVKLELLVRVVNAELLERVHGEALETENVKDACGLRALLGGADTWRKNMMNLAFKK